MNTLRELRQKMGLTQVEMATLLFISEQMESMVECGLRDLSPQAFSRYLYIKAQFEKPVSSSTADTQAIGSEELLIVRSKFEKDISDREYELRNLNHRIAKMIQEFDRVQHTLGVLRNEMELFSGVQNYISVVEKYYHEQLEIFRENHPIHQSVLQERALQLSEKIVQLKNQLASLNIFFNTVN